MTCHIMSDLIFVMLMIVRLILLTEYYECDCLGTQIYPIDWVIWLWVLARIVNQVKCLLNFQVYLCENFYFWIYFEQFFRAGTIKTNINNFCSLTISKIQKRDIYFSVCIFVGKNVLINLFCLKLKKIRETSLGEMLRNAWTLNDLITSILFIVVIVIKIYYVSVYKPNTSPFECPTYGVYAPEELKVGRVVLLKWLQLFFGSSLSLSLSLSCSYFLLTAFPGGCGGSVISLG